jgi:hypothetical protein
VIKKSLFRFGKGIFLLFKIFRNVGFIVILFPDFYSNRPVGFFLFGKNRSTLRRSVLLSALALFLSVILSYIHLDLRMAPVYSLDGKTISFTAQQFLKQVPGIEVTPYGILISFRALQEAKPSLLPCTIPVGRYSIL